MQQTFYNQPVVNWAQQTLAEPVEIKLQFASRRARLIVYALLLSVPFLIIAALIFLKLSGGTDAKWWGIFLCGGVLILPAIVIILLGSLTRQKLVKALDAAGVKSSLGKRFLWENLYYVDHVSKITRFGGVTRKTEDNQLELVFADGKAIIPPLIYDRERIWSLINSAPAQVKFDGEIRTAQPQNPAGSANFDAIARAMGEMKAQRDQNK